MLLAVPDTQHAHACCHRVEDNITLSAICHGGNERTCQHDTYARRHGRSGLPEESTHSVQSLHLVVLAGFVAHSRKGRTTKGVPGWYYQPLRVKAWMTGISGGEAHTRSKPLHCIVLAYSAPAEALMVLLLVAAYCDLLHRSSPDLQPGGCWMQIFPWGRSFPHPPVCRRPP